MTSDERKERIERLARAIVTRIGVGYTLDDLIVLIGTHFPAADGRNAAGQVVEYLHTNGAGQKFNFVQPLDVTAISVTSGGAAQLGKTTFVPFTDQDSFAVITVKPTTTTQTKP